MRERVKTQLLVIRNIGFANMFIVHEVQRIAEEHRREYTQFILTGETSK